MAEDATEELFEQLNCAVTTKEHSHICDEPITFGCSHNACNKCVEEKQKHGFVKCFYCNEYIEIKNDERIGANELFDSVLNNNLTELLNKTITKLKSKIQIYKDSVSDCKRTIDDKAESVSFQIDIKIESLKCELENLRESLQNELKTVKDTLNTELEKQFVKEEDMETLENDIQSVDTLFTDEMQQRKEMLYVYQNKLKTFNDHITELENNLPLIEFTENSDHTFLTSSNIGQIIYRSKKDERCIVEKLTKQIEEANFDFHVLENLKQPSGFCVLPDDRLLIYDNLAHKFYIYDSNFKLLDQLNGSEGKVVAIDTNKKDSIYFLTSRPSNLIKKDMKFDTIARLDYNDGQWKQISGFCYHDDFIYVCEHLVKQVSILDKNLKYLRSYELDFNPKKIRCTNGVACIEMQDTSGYTFSEFISFYNLKDFSKIREHNLGHYNSFYISNSDMHFYELFGIDVKIIGYPIDNDEYLVPISAEPMIRIYDDKGEILALKEFPRNPLFGYIRNMFYFKNSIFAFSYKNDAIRIIRFKV